MKCQISPNDDDDDDAINQPPVIFCQPLTSSKLTHHQITIKTYTKNETHTHRTFAQFIQIPCDDSLEACTYLRCLLTSIYRISINTYTVINHLKDCKRAKANERRKKSGATRAHQMKFVTSVKCK